MALTTHNNYGDANTNRMQMLIRCLCVIIISGACNTCAVFVQPLADLYHWEISAVASVATYMVMMWTPGHIICGKLMSKYGPRGAMLVASVTFAMAYILSAMVPQSAPWLLYVTFSVIQGISVGLTYTSSIYTAQAWFPDKPGFASGMCLGAHGLSGVILAPILASLLQEFGVRTTLYMLGVFCFVVIGAAGIGIKAAPVGYTPAGFVKKETKATYESYTPARAVKTSPFWHLLLAFGFFPAMYIICYPRFSVFMTDAGFSVAAGTLGVTIYNAAALVGKLFIGMLIDKFGYKKIYAFCGVCCVLSSLCLVVADSLLMFYLAYILLGLGFGTTNSVHPVAISTTFGTQYSGSIFGWCMLGYMGIATFLSPNLSNLMVKATGSYTLSMIYAICACIVAVILYCTIKPVPRKPLSELAEPAEEK